MTHLQVGVFFTFVLLSGSRPDGVECSCTTSDKIRTETEIHAASVHVHEVLRKSCQRDRSDQTSVLQVSWLKAWWFLDFLFLERVYLLWRKVVHVQRLLWQCLSDRLDFGRWFEHMGARRGSYVADQFSQLCVLCATRLVLSAVKLVFCCFIPCGVNFILFRPSATKSGRPYGVTSASSLSLSSCGTPHPHPTGLTSHLTLWWHHVIMWWFPRDLIEGADEVYWLLTEVANIFPQNTRSHILKREIWPKGQGTLLPPLHYGVGGVTSWGWHVNGGSGTSLAYPGVGGFTCQKSKCHLKCLNRCTSLLKAVSHLPWNDIAIVMSLLTFGPYLVDGQQGGGGGTSVGDGMSVGGTSVGGGFGIDFGPHWVDDQQGWGWHPW